MNNLFQKISGIFIALLFVFTANASTIIDGYFERDGQKRPGVRAVFDASPDEVKKAFKKFVKDNYDTRLKGIGLFSNKDELYAEKVIIPALSEKNINFYAQIIEYQKDDEQTILTTFTSLGYDVYLNEEDYPDGYQAMIDMVNDFVTQFVPNYHQEKIANTKKELEDLQDDLADYEKEVADSQEEIEELKEEIEKLQSKKEKKQKAIEEKKSLLKKQENRYNQVQIELKR